MSDIVHRFFYQFLPPGPDDPKRAVNLEHENISVDQAATYLIGQGALPHTACNHCGQPIPEPGTKVRLVHWFGHWQADEMMPTATRWKRVTEDAEDWDTFPLSREKGGN